ncbi:MAG: hypothetical protein EGQ84_08005 [Slackia sp.]|nr:hypothetical protein [Slackia sp.]
MRYCQARHEREDEERSWRVYMSDQAALTPQNKFIKKPWREIVGSARKPVDRRSAEEIAEEVMAKAKI